jgi:hypothetical protein
MEEVRTTADIIRDLLEIAVEHEWVDVRVPCGRGCCSDSIVQCSSCDGLQPGSTNESRRSKLTFGHAEDCKLKALITEAEAFLRAEDSVAEAAA